MNSNTALARIVASWAQHPDPDLIRHALTTWDDRHSLATLCADADLDLPDDITELVLALIEADPLARSAAREAWVWGSLGQRS